MSTKTSPRRAALRQTRRVERATGCAVPVRSGSYATFGLPTLTPGPREAR